MGTKNSIFYSRISLVLYTVYSNHYLSTVYRNLFWKFVQFDLKLITVLENEIILLTACMEIDFFLYNL